jgi:hypothetical protein
MASPNMSFALKVISCCRNIALGWKKDAICCKFVVGSMVVMISVGVVVCRGSSGRPAK